MIGWVEQRICTIFCVNLEHSSMETIQMIQKPASMGNWWLAASSRPCTAHASCLMHSFLVKYQITQVTQPRYSPDLVPCNSRLFPKLKSPLKGNRSQTISESQKGQLMATGRTVWGPKVPTLKGTEVLLSYVQCFLCLLSSSVNTSNFHITWLDTCLFSLPK